MGLFDAVKGALGQVEAAAVPTLIDAALAKTNLGDLNGLVTRLQQGGLDRRFSPGGGAAKISLSPLTNCGRLSETSR